MMMMMMKTARDEYTKIIGKRRLKAAEKGFISSTLPLSLHSEDKVLLYHETEGR